MSYQRTIEYLYSLQKLGMKFGLDNISGLLLSAGSPQESFRSVHVAGTNGKGSTSAMIESILRTSGVTTGLFTSPHLVSFTERIRINGVEISEGEVIALAAEVREIADAAGLSPTFFEVVTAMAFLHFKRAGVQWAVIETGLGGRLDSTNVIHPEVSVITPVSIDHCEFLGNSMKEIAGEKAGIIKKNVPVVCGPQTTEALAVLAAKAREKSSPLFGYGADFHSRMDSESFDGITFTYRGKSEYRGLVLPLAGGHQIVNASLAIRTVELLSDRYPDLRCDVRGGLAAVKWPGRLELIREDPPVLIDGAHNPDAAAVLSNHLKKMLSAYKKIVLVIGIMADKDIDGIMRELLPVASEIICTAASYGRAASAESLSEHAASLGFASRKTDDLSGALSLAEELCGPDDIIVVTGSFYTIGETREILISKGVLSRLRE